MTSIAPRSGAAEAGRPETVSTEAGPLETVSTEPAPAGLETDWFDVAEFEVATTSSDTLRASVLVAGTLTARTVPLLLSVLQTHVRAGRRYLRVDLSDVEVDDVGVLEPLRAAHRAMTDLDGMLVFENVGDALGRLIQDGDLFVSTAR
jgi:anti-anti-sigma regulatory factor